MRAPLAQGIAVLVVLSGWMLGVSAVARAGCDEGTVVSDPDTGTIQVSYVATDSAGRSVPHDITMIRPTHFTPAVTASSSFDRNGGLYRYEYVVSNSLASKQQIGAIEFGLPSTIATSDHVGPSSPGWFFSPAMEESGFSWSFLPGTARPDMSIEGIPRGGSTAFSFASPNGPGPMTVYLRGVEADVGFPDLPGCLEDAILDETGFPKDDVAIVTQGPVTR